MPGRVAPPPVLETVQVYDGPGSDHQLSHPPKAPHTARHAPLEAWRGQGGELLVGGHALGQGSGPGPVITSEGVVTRHGPGLVTAPDQDHVVVVTCHVSPRQHVMTRTYLQVRTCGWVQSTAGFIYISYTLT